MSAPPSSGSPSRIHKRRRTEDARAKSARDSSSHVLLDPLCTSYSCAPASDHLRDDGRDEVDPYGDEDWEDAVPNDTMATILSLQREFYGDALARGGDGRARTGIVLQHQIYTILDNRTAVDLELTTMRSNNTLRTFRLNTGREDWAVMSTEHYLKVISNVFTGSGRIDSSGGSGSTPKDSSSSGMAETRLWKNSSARLGDVLRSLVHSVPKAYASRREIVGTMDKVLSEQLEEKSEGLVDRSFKDAQACALGTTARSREKGRVKGIVATGESSHGKRGSSDLRSIKQEDARVVSLIGELIRAGFLVPRRDVGGEDAYWFSMPQLGKVIVAVSRGRKDVVNMIKRTRYKEIRRATLESKNRVKTGLPLSFHIRDLVGLGRLREMETPSGMFLRVAPDA